MYEKDTHKMSEQNVSSSLELFIGKTCLPPMLTSAALCTFGTTPLYSPLTPLSATILLNASNAPFTLKWDIPVVTSTLYLYCQIGLKQSTLNGSEYCKSTFIRPQERFSSSLQEPCQTHHKPVILNVKISYHEPIYLK